ncbi:hypothetical protein WR25_08782 isoform C [Diploscapter pachys]|uniref:Uncharacterized protein n=1 Tax=Diploscapter pachys TaxID=2018661 RepID=A0A2A2KRS7_9BILA|nr:hypothetical protein WR25_08782 isoform C [Diploscapter pachys]
MNGPLKIAAGDKQLYALNQSPNYMTPFNGSSSLLNYRRRSSQFNQELINQIDQIEAPNEPSVSRRINMLLPELPAGILRHLYVNNHLSRYEQRRCSENVVTRFKQQECGRSRSEEKKERSKSISVKWSVDELSSSECWYANSYTNSTSEDCISCISGRATPSLASDTSSILDFSSFNFFFQTKTVDIPLSLLIEHLLFVEAFGRVWVAGWTQQLEDKGYRHSFSFADELIQVGNTPIRGIDNIPDVFYTSSMGPEPISLILRITPYAKIIRLKKPINPNKEIGIVMHKNKNRIGSVEPDSIASRRGVSIHMTAVSKRDKKTYAVST